MEISKRAKKIHHQINQENTKLGDLRKIAKEIKKDHGLAKELWSTGCFYPRQLAILIMDKKELNQDVLDKLFKDMLSHNDDERNHLADWLMANQLMKDKLLTNLIGLWRERDVALQRRIFWYHQARLRWTGQKPPDNSKQLLTFIEESIMTEKPEVQWAMNFTAGQIGIHEIKLRERCIAIGESTGLYKDDYVAKNCTPSYLPEFIAIEVEKWKNRNSKDF